MQNTEKQKTIVTIIEEVLEEMCDKYCKYPEMIPDLDEQILDETAPCESCPLNRLV